MQFFGKIIFLEHLEKENMVFRAVYGPFSFDIFLDIRLVTNDVNMYTFFFYLHYVRLLFYED